MTTISLHKYHDQINHLLEDSQYSLAANHCRYILQQHPRHVDTYRLLARTMIEQGDYSGATELFQRVLSADPNDYIAHAGLSVVYREEDVLSQALWHLERAYEIEPYNGAIQQELKSLYIDFSEQKAVQQQGEVEVDVPESLPLTRGALARLYIQGEFYAQAIGILEEAIAEDEDRIDLEVLLVEALWRDNQRKAAVQICLQVLEKLPNCIIANAVLAEIWLQIGRIDEAQDYLNELQALTLMDISNQDLESPAGSAFQPEGAIALPAVFELERMGDDMTSLSDGTSPEIYSDDSAKATEGDDDYQWLEGLGEELVVGEADPSPDEPVSAVTDSDWLRRELDEVPDEETAVSDDIASWLDETDPADSVEEESGIDPLGMVVAGAVAAGVIGSQLKDDDDAQDEDDSFDWLSGESFEDDVPAEDETIFAQIEDAEEAEEMPDWLADMAGDDLEPVQVDLADAAIFIEDDEESDNLSETEDEGEDIYDWLEDVTSDEAVDELEPGEIDLSQFAEFDEGKETDDDDGEIVWRLTDELNPPEEIEDAAEIEEFEEDESLEDLGGFDFDISPDETGELEDVPDWLMGSRGTDELDAASPTEVAGSEVADELADWVAAIQPEMDDVEELPDWLSDESDTLDSSTPDPLVEQTLEVEEDEDDFSTGDLPDWMTDSAVDIDDSAPLDFAELDTPDTATPEHLVEQTLEVEENEDDFFTSELPDWMTDSAADIDDSAPLDPAPLISDNAVADDSAPLTEADLPDWLMGGSMDADDSGFLETGNLLDEPDAVPETSGDLPDWLAGDTDGFAGDEDVQTQVVDEDLPDWLSDNLEVEDVQSVEEDDEDDGLSGTAVVGGLLGAMAAGTVAKEFFDDDDEDNEDQPEQLMQDSSLEDEVTEDAVSGKQDDLIGPQDEPEKPDPLPKEESDEFDWLDDLGDTDLSADTDSLPLDDLGDGLDWMDLDSSGDSDELNLDALLGLESEEEAEPKPVEEEVSEAAPVQAGLAEDESLDWLDALAGDEPEAVDEMPTWQWSEEGEEASELIPNEVDSDSLETAESAVADVDAIFSDEPDEADVVGDLDDAMSWLEDLAAEPDAPVEELPSVAEDMDLDALFAVDSDEDFLNDLSDESGQTETLDEIFAVDTQNDSWLDGLGDGDKEPLPDFLEEDAEFNIDELVDEETVAETAVSATLEESPEAVDDLGGPPEDLDDAMAWLEQLAARQGADLEELPSVNEEPEEDGIGVTEVVAGAAALGAIGAVLNDDEEESETGTDLDDAFEVVEAGVASELVEETVSEDDLMSMEVPEDPDEAMAWLEKLAARQGAPLEELPSVSADDEIPAESKAVAEDDLFGLDTDDSDFDDLLAGADVLPELAESDDDALTDLDDAMSWLDGLEEDADLAEPVTEDAPDDLGDFDFGDEEIDIFEAEEILAEENEPDTSAPDALSAELDWLESVTSSDVEPVAYNADELSVSDDDLSDALDKLALLSVAGAAIGMVSADEEDEPEIEEIVAEMAVSDEPEASADIAATDFVEEMPEDPDEAMAWLEKLAARQGANLDELPSVNEDEYDDLAAAGAASRAEAEAEALLEEASIADETSIDELVVAEETAEAASPEEMDVDDAMAWLEQLAARQGADLDELPSVDESDLQEDVVAPDWVADAQEDAEEELLVAEVEPTIEEASEIAAESDSVDLPEDMDMDDAMAWLEQLAARQGADLDELPSVDGTPDADTDIDTPEWIANQTGPLDPGVLDSLEIPEVSDESLDAASDEDFFAALDEVPAIEGIETGIKDVDSDLAPDLEDLDDSMPDWLSGGQESEDDVALGHTGWLNTLDEPDMGDWLAAEAEASSSSDLLGDAMPEAVDTDSLISTGGLEDTGGLQDRTGRGGTGELRLPDDMSAGSMFTAELDEAQVLADLDLDGFGAGLDQAQLESARSSLASGDIDAALHDFQGLVEAGDSMHTVITELERAAELYQDKPQVRRMLGDAYMRNGQINKAIETYRDALDQM